MRVVRTAFCSENQFQRQLQLPRVNSSASNLAVIGATDGRIRGTKDRVVRQVKAFRPELQSSYFRDPEVLVH